MPERALSPVALLVLSSLAESPGHGYAILKDVARRSDGRVSPGATSLYRTLWQLLEEGLIAESSRRPAVALDDERRTYFRITGAGRRALAAEVARLESLLLSVRPQAAARKARS